MTENTVDNYPPIYPEGEEAEYIRENWYSVPDVARLFGYVPATVYYQVKNGLLPVAILGGEDDSPRMDKYRIDPDYIEALLDARDRMQDWYSVTEAARVLGVSAKSIYEMLWDGRLRGEKINDSQWRIDNEQVDAAARRISEKQIAVRKAVLDAL